MKWTAIFIIPIAITAFVTGCSFNPFTPNHQETGSPTGAAIGAGIGAGSVAALGGTRVPIGIAGLAGGAIGYYVTTLRYASSGVIQAGGTVYKLGDLVGINIPSEKLFEPNTAEFLPQAADILHSTVEILRRYPTNNILISGNTSGFYRPKWEQALSEKRAQKVAGFLWYEGINNFKTPQNDLRKLNYVGYGSYFPISQTLTNRGIRDNSRVQIISYPTNCDLGLDKYHLAVHNIGGIDTDQAISQAPSHCDTMNAKGECLDR